MYLDRWWGTGVALGAAGEIEHSSYDWDVNPIEKQRFGGAKISLGTQPALKNLSGAKIVGED